MPHTAFIGVGSNLGDPLQHCRAALSQIRSHPSLTLVHQSHFYKSEPFGKQDQDWFVNLVIQIQTDLSARALLDALMSLELAMGRERGEKWGPRIIDLDILFYDTVVFDEENLRIPHPGIPERRFVLEPLNELADNLIHPVLNKSIGTLLSELQDNLKIERMDSPV